jgi:hypothetical protein
MTETRGLLSGQMFVCETCGEIVYPASERLRNALAELGQVMSKQLEPPVQALQVGLRALHDAIHTHRSTR